MDASPSVTVIMSITAKSVDAKNVGASRKKVVSLGLIVIAITNKNMVHVMNTENAITNYVQETIEVCIIIMCKV